MRRAIREVGIVLSYRDNKVEKMNTDEVKSMTQKDLKALNALLRKKAEKEAWAYDITECPSMINPRNLRAERPHIHVCLRGNPGTTIAKWMMEYWYKKHGIAEMIDLYDLKTFRDGYMKAQAVFTWHQTKETELLETIDLPQGTEKSGCTGA